MTAIEFWPGLREAWESLDSFTPESMQSVPESGGIRWTVIKSESRSRIVWLEAPGCVPLVCKIYRTPPRLAWRTFGLASRANREFTIMMQAHRLGLQVVRARYWLECRKRGCVAFSAIALDAIDGPDLEDWLTGEARGEADRLEMARAAGSLVGRFHRAGLFWGTVTPRNLLLPNGDGARMVAIDLPYARLHGHSIVGNDHAMTDLSCLLRLSDGGLAFSGQEREALMLGYCDGDEEQARALNLQVRLMSHREWKKQRFLRRLNNLIFRNTRSSGGGGVYCSETGAYSPIESKAVFITQSVD
jgi:tRNA A-37 threonylcarbamoyl transferase component Bud32